MSKQNNFLKISFVMVVFLAAPVHSQIAAETSAPASENAEPVAEAPPPAPTATEEGLALLKKRGLSNCKKAVDKFREALGNASDELDAKLNLVDALNCVMRIRTHGNIPLIEGTNDTEPHKKIWGQMGPETLALAEEVYKARPNDIRALAAYTDAYMYRSSAWGIVNAVVKGAADQYVENAEKMTKKFPKYDSGLGHAFMGAFYLLAPWPLSDEEKARARMEAAHRAGPNSKRNNYYLGVVAYREGEFQEAIGHFERAKSAKCLSPAERDFCTFMKRQIIHGITRSKEQL